MQREYFSNVNNINLSLPLEHKYTTKDDLSFGVTISEDIQGSEVSVTKYKKIDNNSAMTTLLIIIIFTAAYFAIER